MENVQGSGNFPDAVGSCLKIFAPGDEVLCLDDNNKYLLGTIIEVNKMESQVHVQFSNDTSWWSPASAVRSLAKRDVLDLCQKCGKEMQELTRCRACTKVFHKLCQKPTTDGLCSKCCLQKSTKENIRRPMPLPRNPPRPRRIQSGKRVLPYQLQSLTWDAFHRTNKENTYCYCGTGGEWSKKMLQCSQCRQWFHGSCLSCLRYPLLNGDRFYKFICGICNSGAEYLSRLPLTIVDALRIILFDLQEETGEKMLDLDRLILPHLARKWEALQLPSSLRNLTESERKELVVKELASNKQHFINGREYRKKNSLWALRISVPPTPCLREVSNGSPAKHTPKSPEKECKIKALKVLGQPDIVLSTLSASTVGELMNVAKGETDSEETPDVSSHTPSTRASSEERPLVMGANERLLRTRSASLLAPVIAETYNYNKDATDANALADALKTISRKRKRKSSISGSASTATPAESDPLLLNGTINILDHITSLAQQYGDHTNPFRWEAKKSGRKNRKLSAKDLIIRNDGEIRLRKKRRKNLKKCPPVVVETKADPNRTCIARRVLPLGGFVYIYEDE